MLYSKHVLHTKFDIYVFTFSYIYIFECVLHFMVGSTEGTEGVSRDIIDVLLHAGLMKKLVILNFY